jgi:hypothetical protein
MTYPGDMWMVAFVVVPVVVLVMAGVAVVLSDYESRRHDRKRAAKSREFCDRMSGKQK